jgi:UDP-GlcNAc:undecaprenyl-phosphate GlcNAc-1-phosphate transferase
LVFLLGALAVAAAGLVDDWRTLRPGPKLLVECGAAVALWVVGVRAGMFGVAALDLGLTVLWVVAVTNALNLLDNMDGLASGVAAVAALAFSAVAASRGDYLVGQLALAVAGGSVGFLLHNFPPAKVFLGDAGTLMLGFLLASLGLKLDMVGQNGLVRSAVPALIVAVPLIDTAFVVIRRLREGRPIVRGGTDHSSHLLAALGLSPRSVALVTYLAQAAGCATALALLEASSEVAFGMFVLSAVAAVAVVAALLIVSAERDRPSAEVAPARLASVSEHPAEP